MNCEICTQKEAKLRSYEMLSLLTGSFRSIEKTLCVDCHKWWLKNNERVRWNR